MAAHACIKAAMTPLRDPLAKNLRALARHYRGRAPAPWSNL